MHYSRIRYIFSKSCGVVLLCLFLGMAYGQEEQVAFLPGVFELSEKQRSRANVFTEYAAAFYKAQLFKIHSNYILRIEYQDGHNYWKVDRSISNEEVMELRHILQATLIDSPTETTQDKTSNRRLFLITSISLNAIPQSLIFSNAFREDYTIESFFGSFPGRRRTNFGRSLPYFATVGAITSSILFTRNKEILPSAASMYFWGSLFGYGHGLALTSMIREPYRSNTNLSLESVIISGTSLLEGWAGYHMAKKNNFSRAQSRALISGNFWGGFSGLMAAGIFAHYNEFDFLESGPFGFYSVCGSVMGLFAANNLLDKYPRTSGDLTAINMGGLIGISWGSAIGVGLNDYGRTFSAGTLLGTLGGLSLAATQTKNTNFTNLEGGIISVVSISGGLVSLGLAGLLDANEFGYSFAASTGLTAGYIISFKIFANNKTRFNSLGFGEKIKWTVNPAGLGMAMSSPDQQANLMRQNIRMDLLTLNYAF